MRSFWENVDLYCKLGSGFFATGYDLFVMDIVLAILQGLSDEDPSGIGFSSSTSSLVASATSLRGVIGMLFFGIVGDTVGPLIGLIITGALVVVGSLLSAACIRSDSISLCVQMAIYRAILGFGMGGEFPITATIAGEGSGVKVRGRALVGIFSLQGFGLLFSSLLSFIILQCGAPLEFTWRFLLGFTSIPGAISIWLRVRLFRDLQKIKKEKSDNSSTVAIPQVKTCKRTIIRNVLHVLRVNRTLLIATCSTWFIMDITFFGTGVFRHSVSEQVYITRVGTSAHVVATHDATFGLIIAGASMLGYICAIIWLDVIGRWNLQTYGFIAMGLTYIAMALTVQFDSPYVWLNVFIFASTFFFTAFGPNTTTFMIPSDIYSSKYKTLCHGLSASSGKLGAVVGIAIFPPLMDSLGLAGTMYFCGGVAMFGCVVTLICLNKKQIDDSVTNAARNAIDRRVSNVSSTSSWPPAPTQEIPNISNPN